MAELSLVLHVIAATLLVGPQVLLFFAVVPATWFVDDEQLRRDVTRTIVGRYGMIAGIAVVILLVTGLYQFYSVTPDYITEDMSSYRFGWIFITKMTLFTMLIVLIGVHAVVGRRIGRLTDQVIAGEGDAARLDDARRLSFMVSAGMMLVSIGVLVFGVLLGRIEYSYVLS